MFVNNGLQFPATVNQEEVEMQVNIALYYRQQDIHTVGVFSVMSTRMNTNAKCTHTLCIFLQTQGVLLIHDKHSCKKCLSIDFLMLHLECQTV